jgi:two-component system, chemotaxis family, protein-glutamate methylesterase/glutaminase
MLIARYRQRRRRFCGVASARSPLIPHGVLLVDDQPEFLQVAQDLLAGNPDVTVIGTACNGEEAIALVAALAPDLVVLDVQMPGMSGFETAKRLVASSPGLRIVMVSSDGEPDYELFARSAGAEAFLTKKQFLGDGLAPILSN